MTVCDKDDVTPDDHLFTVRFDIARLPDNESVFMTFKSDPQAQEELDVEFLVEPAPGPSETIVTNGVLVTLLRSSQYFAKQGIPFPKIDLNNIKDTELQECYVFEDAEDSRAPIVIFFPLINDSFRKYKAPGVKRSPWEMKEGEVDVISAFSPYGLQNFTYTEEEFDKLVELTSYNIQNNKNMIYGALQRAVKRKQKK
uniref:Uncharacterized protein n=1 Tax=Sphaerodactylus townsendi TaxID=933632 RepID=A0ACB8G5U3_9SAUR